MKIKRSEKLRKQVEILQSFKFQFVPSMITVMGMAVGINAIRFIFNHQIDKAVICIIVAVVLDGLDGKIARYLRAVSKFGSNLDTLSDFLNFGIVPAFMMYIKYESITHNKLYWVCCVVYIICAALRLARFSVNGLSVDNTFSGLPSTGGAFLVTMPLCLEYCKFGISKTFLGYFSMLLLIFIAIMMVASMQVFSLSRIKIHHNVFPFLFIALAIVLSLLNSYTWHIIICLQILYVAMLFILSPGKNKNIK